MTQFSARARLLAAGAIVVLLTAPAQAAKLYKWKDDQGNITYSQLPPPKSNATQLELRGVQGVSNEEARERLDSLSGRAETARKDREFKSDYTSESRDREERMKANCETARQNLRILETASRVKTEQGEFMNDAQRQERIASAQKQVADFCK
jgi:hypothetical protein